MASALVAAGIRRIEGRVVGHEGAFTADRLGDAWTWEDLAWGYGAPVSALSFADNLVKVTLRPGEREGDPAVLDADPDGALVLSSHGRDRGGGRARGRSPRAGAGLRRRAPLGIAADRRRAGTASWPCPTRRATRRRRFARVLEAKGIRVAGGIATTREPLPAGARVLAAHDVARRWPRWCAS